MATFEVNNWLLVASILGTFFGMIVRIVNQGKTERTKIENPQPDKPSVMTVSSVIQFTKDITSYVVNDIMTMVLGAPAVKTAVEKINPVDTLPKTTSELVSVKQELDSIKVDFGSIMSAVNLKLEEFQHHIAEIEGCPPDVKEACLKYLEETKKVINGGVSDNVG